MGEQRKGGLIARPSVSWMVGPFLCGFSTLVSAGSGTRTTAEVTSVTNGTEYIFTVQAAEVSGGQTVVTGPGSSVEATPQVVVPAPPTGLIATPKKYQYSGHGCTDINGSDRDTTSFTFTGLENGETYGLDIRASNLSGESAATYVTAVPGWPAPTNLVVGVDSTRIVLQWDTGDSEITHYLVGFYAAGSGQYTETVVPAGSGSKTTAEITSLSVSPAGPGPESGRRSSKYCWRTRTTGT